MVRDVEEVLAVVGELVLADDAVGQQDLADGEGPDDARGLLRGLKESPQDGMGPRRLFGHLGHRIADEAGGRKPLRPFRRRTYAPALSNYFKLLWHLSGPIRSGAR
jgi:hypothetical protein